jgi:hypothetical protein
MIIIADWDDEARVWTLTDSSIDGLAGESDDLPGLLRVLAERIESLEAAQFCATVGCG